MGDVAYEQILPPGEMGDRTFEITLTTREASAFGLAMLTFVSSPLMRSLYASLMRDDEACGEGFALGLAEMNTRIGLANAKALGVTDHMDYLRGSVARIDQEKARWRDAA